MRTSSNDVGLPRLSNRLGNHRRPLSWAGFGLLLLLFFIAGWLGFGAIEAKSNLDGARNSAEQSKAALLDGKSDEAIRWAKNAQAHALKARAATHSPPWKLVASVPLLGSPLKATQQISDIIVGLADEILLPVADIGSTVSLDGLFDGTRLDLNRLRAEQSRLHDLSMAATELNDAAQAISKPAYISVIREARTQLQEETSKLSKLLTDTAIAAQLAPSMLGAEGPRTYLMAFQTNSEARGTGGLVGGFGVLRFDDGAPSVEMLSSNLQLAVARANVDFGRDFDTTYGWTRPYTDFRNSNLSAHFPYAAQLWKGMWEGNTNTKVDGVIVVDLVALSYVLGAIGPVAMPDGEVITQDNFIELTGSTIYHRYPSASDQDARKEYLQNIARQIVTEATSKLKAPSRLLTALSRAATERRIAVWSASPAEQELLESTPLAHVIPEVTAPYAQVVINNLAGNKMDYYLRREIAYDADECDGPMRNSTVTVRLTNTASRGSMPDYYASAEGIDPKFQANIPLGTMVSSVRLVATNGSKLMSVTSNGERANAITAVERGHPSFEIQLAIPPGKSAEIIFRLTEPTAAGEPRVPVQPLIDTIVPKISVPTCSK